MNSLVAFISITIEVSKCFGEKSIITWFTKLFNKIMRSKKMLHLQRKSMIIYKNKGDVTS